MGSHTHLVTCRGRFNSSCLVAAVVGLFPSPARKLARLIFVSTLGMLGAGFVSPALAQTSIPEAFCTGDHNQLLNQSPLKNALIKTDLPTSVAEELGIYNFGGQLLLAPRGWSCKSRGQWDASGISIMPPDSKDQSHGVVVADFFGDLVYDTQGRMYPLANAFFPGETKREKDAGYGPPTSRILGRYATDTVIFLPPLEENYIGFQESHQYNAALIAEYTTPPHHIGIGSKIFFGFGSNGLTLQGSQVSDQPIQGSVVLHLSPWGRISGLGILAMSLPENLSSLGPYIQKFEESSEVNMPWQASIYKSGILDWPQ